MTSNKLSRRAALGLAGALLAGATTFANALPAYPSRPVKLIVPFPAGTSPDVIARLWGDEFAKATGQAVVVENRPGASTIIAVQAAANAAPDGYTLLWTVNNTFSINPYVYKKLPCKAEDFVAVTRILSVPYVLVTSNESKHSARFDRLFLAPDFARTHHC
jgi:tripartite-type tricarboxylate transporter receptor subunit TctC